MSASKPTDLLERRIVMELKKLGHWNWFKKEDDYSRQSTLPVPSSG